MKNKDNLWVSKSLNGGIGDLMGFSFGPSEVGKPWTLHFSYMGCLEI